MHIRLIYALTIAYLVTPVSTTLLNLL